MKPVSTLRQSVDTNYSYKTQHIVNSVSGVLTTLIFIGRSPCKYNTWTVI
jgi:hypothetical protein